MKYQADKHGKDVYYNQVELEDINSGLVDRLEGGSFFLPVLASALLPSVQKMIGGSCSCEMIEQELSGGSVFGDFAKSIARNLLKKGLEVGSQKAVEGLSAAIDKKLGGVKKSKVSAPVPMNFIENPLYEKPRAEIVELQRKPAVKKGGKVDGRAKRAEVVKKVMKLHGLSLPEASKYVKENKIKY